MIANISALSDAHFKSHTSFLSKSRIVPGSTLGVDAVLGAAATSPLLELVLGPKCKSFKIPERSRSAIRVELQFKYMATGTTGEVNLFSRVKEGIEYCKSTPDSLEIINMESEAAILVIGSSD